MVDCKILPGETHAVIGEALVAELVAGVAGVGDDLPQENFLMGVDGVDHQVQQPLGLRLKLFLCHENALP